MEARRAMRASDLLAYSARALRGHRLRTFLCLLGVAIGVASVILLTSLGEGARLYVTREFSSLGSNLLILLPGKTETFGAAPMVSHAPHDLTMEDLEALSRRVPQIQRIAPVVFGTAKATVGDRSRDILVIGTTNEMLEVRHLKMGIGRFLPAGVKDAPVCVLGATVQSELFGAENPLGEWIRIGENRFRVLGVITPRGTSIGMNLDEVVEVPVESAMRMFNQTSLFRVLAEVRNNREIDAARTAALQVLKERHEGEEDVTVLTQDAVLSTFNKILSILTAALAGIAAISLSVAGIGIMNVMLVAIAERTREIGLLKAVGVRGRQVLYVFLLEAALISTAGGLLGLLAGFGAGRLLRAIYPEFPVQPPLWAVIASLIVSVSVGILFGSLPARRAARLDPIEALMRKRG
jgi:putative ABC transport system permease protein